MYMEITRTHAERLAGSSFRNLVGQSRYVAYRKVTIGRITISATLTTKGLVFHIES